MAPKVSLIIFITGAALAFRRHLIETRVKLAKKYMAKKYADMFCVGSALGMWIQIQEHVN
jgi:hypothetical protein